MWFEEKPEPCEIMSKFWQEEPPKILGYVFWSLARTFWPCLTYIREGDRDLITVKISLRSDSSPITTKAFCST